MGPSIIEDCSELKKKCYTPSLKCGSPYSIPLWLSIWLKARIYRASPLPTTASPSGVTPQIIMIITP